MRSSDDEADEVCALEVHSPGEELDYGGAVRALGGADDCHDAVGVIALVNLLGLVVGEDWAGRLIPGEYVPVVGADSVFAILCGMEDGARTVSVMRLRAGGHFACPFLLTKEVDLEHLRQ